MAVKTQDTPALTRLQSVAIDQAVAALAMGGVVAMPTETVYGLAADVMHPGALTRVYTLKQRPAGHPLIVHVGHQDEIEKWATDVPALAHRAVAQFWPGPLSIVLKRDRKVSDLVTGGQDTVALRMPSHPVALELLRRFSLSHSGALAAPSANRYGRISPTRIEHVESEFRVGVQVFIDGGPCERGIESTILDLSRDRPYLLRPGSISREQLSACLDMEVLLPDGHAPRVPGSTLSHYAPVTPTILCSPAELEAKLSDRRDLDVGVFALRDAFCEGLVWLRAPDDAEDYARVLYAGLRQLDRAGLDYILVEAPPLASEWAAIHDRLTRACARK
jgi:L-threonylcarbamoyladenylate synthase